MLFSHPHPPPPPPLCSAVDHLPPIPMLIFKSRICFSWLSVISDPLYRRFPILPFFSLVPRPAVLGMGGSTVSLNHLSPASGGIGPLGVGLSISKPSLNRLLTVSLCQVESSY